MVPFSKNSLTNGLEILIDIEAFDYAMSPTEGEGIVVSVLHQLDIPIMKNTGIHAQPGKAIQVCNCRSFAKGLKNTWQPFGM